MKQANRRLFFVTLGVLFFNLSTVAHAYTWYNDRGFHQWYFNGGAGSTVEGDWARGMAYYVDAVGRLHVNNAIAAQHFQQAYTLYLQNQKLRVKTYYEIKDIRDNYVAKKKAEEEAKRAALRQTASPPRLSVKQRDPLTGALSWPTALMAEMFQQDREDVEALFLDRAAHPGSAGEGTDNQANISKLVHQMQGKLFEQVHRLPPMDYLSAAKFLRTLVFEAGFSN